MENFLQCFGFCDLLHFINILQLINKKQDLLKKKIQKRHIILYSNGLYIYISGNSKCSKMADHILEMAGLGLFFIIVSSIIFVKLNYKVV